MAAGRADVLLVSLGSTAGLRAADAELAGALRRAGATVAVVTAAPPRAVRTLALTDLGWARAARRAARQGLAEHRPRAVLYATTTAALLWPRPGAVRFDAPAAANRPGRHGVWQRPLERRRLVQAPLLVPQAAGALDEAGWTARRRPRSSCPSRSSPAAPRRRGRTATSRRSPTPRTRPRRGSTASWRRGRGSAAPARSSS